ncbi:MAG: endonuclease/exonuclease/phosphatase family protein, partial [Candidatus Thiodiazotropha taylori]|nr:endonuclease/exonuclease/phosphatase family protein [Candidatus Thiodiazotropha taylori]MCW4335130.1 endonuclease/exonuclease/phosphatase family protein [Candidatus Thiodiazotropha endolucinida]
MSGDVEVNPGPDSVEGTLTDSRDDASVTSFELLSNHLSIVHLNVQSIVPKIDSIRSEADSYDVLVFSESWLKPNIHSDNISIEKILPPFRADRSDRPGGGVIVYVRDTLFCKRRIDLEIQGIECVWVELQIKSKRVLIGGFYRPPNSNADYFNLIKESIDRACNTGIGDLIITGDFNINMSQSNNRMIELMHEYSLTQLISEPTHYTEHSSSIIDLILARNTSNILHSGVVDPFIQDYTRYHCPVVVLLKFLRPRKASFKRRIWNYKLADYDKFRKHLSESNIMEKLHSDNNIDHNIQNITDEIFSAAEQSIPNKEVTIKPGDYPWITCHIKNLIRKRKRSYRQFKRTASAYFWNKYKLLRNKVNKEIRKSKQQYFDKLDRQLSCEKCDPKIFWRTSKQLLSLGRTRSNIPTLILNNEHAEIDSQKARMLNQYFSSQTTVNDTNKSLPHLDPVQHNLESITISIQDVKDVLQHLNISKACGPDLISPRLLKEGASLLASPYCTIFNRSLIQ